MRALKRLSHRNWLTLRDLWIGHLPVIDLDNLYPHPTLWELQTIVCPPLNASGTVEFSYIDGVREAIFREAILLARKFIYCGTLLPTLSGNGKNTWTAVSAYEACFYGAKAFCYLLGFANLGRNSSIYVDAFCETERKVGKERKKVYETLRAHKLDDRLTHEMLWALMQRLVDTTTFEGDLRDLQIDLKLTDWDKFTSFRNKIFYDGAFWPLRDNFVACDLAKTVHSPEMTGAATLERESSPLFADEYFVAASLLRDVITGMFETIAELAPAFDVEVEAFNAIRPA